MTEKCFVIAMDIVTSLGWGVEEVWGNILRKECGIRALSRFSLGQYMTDFSAEITDDVEGLLNSYANNESWGRAFSMAYAVSRRALEQIKHDMDMSCVGLVLSTTKAEFEEFERLCQDPQAEVSGRFNPYVMACDLARVLQLGGPVLSVSGACASGLIATIQAASMLDRKLASMMLVVGVDVLTHFVLSGFSSLAALDTRPCRPYDESRSGLSLGEGAGAMLISSVKGGSALAQIRGWGMTNDASHITAPLSDGNGLSSALEKTLGMAGLSASGISYINGHGTGTVYNDDMEANAIERIFGECSTPVSSMKGYFGHTLGAAGVVETALCVKAAMEKVAPASIGFTKTGVSKKVNVISDKIPISKQANIITIKSGFGGINASLALGGV